MIPLFPFTGLVGQPDLTLALLLTAIDPSIGGVLIRGERGSAKSTAARALADVLPPAGGTDGETRAPFIELPLGATEDRIVGSLDLGSALREGRPTLRPGLLALAHGGVLYVDEVNLLADHLVDVLLDAAASGRVTVERDGLSASQEARFLLLGTMNPEEGELRPQFLDRFGLCVDVRAPADLALRAEAIRARLAFDRDPTAFAAAHQTDLATLRQRLVDARARLDILPVEDATITTAAQLCADLKLDGIRGDLTLIRTARALAAWENAPAITATHLQTAARFALPHRQRRRSFERPAPPPAPAPSPAPSPASPPPPETHRTPPDAAPSTPPPTAGDASAPGSETPAPPVSPLAALRLAAPPAASNTAGRQPGGPRPTGSRGRSHPTAPGETPDLVPTLHAAAGRGARVSNGSPLVVADADWRTYQRDGHSGAHVLFVVDASGSMAAQQRLSLAKGALTGLLAGSYQQRDRVALLIFRGETAELVLPFTKDVDLADAALRTVPTGGRTPLAAALRQALPAFPTDGASVLVLFTDGRANVATSAELDPWHEALAAAEALAERLTGALVIDCETGPVRLARAEELAHRLGADCLALDALDADTLTLQLQRRLSCV